MKITKSERVLIGSSNIFRFYKPSDFTEVPDYHLIKCTRISAIMGQMKALEKENKLVVVSVIENFLADAAKAGEQEDPENYRDNFDEILSNAIQEYVDVVKEAATRLPETIILLVKPILRPALNWFDLNFDEICQDLKEKLAKNNFKNVGELESLSRASQFFESDEVHLTKESGRLFVDCILTSAESHYNAGPVVDLDKEEEEEEEVRMETEEPTVEVKKKKESRRVTFKTNQPTIQLQTTPEMPTGLEPRMNVVERNLKKLESDFKTKSWKDSLMMAKLREDFDFMTNVRNEDRVILTGLTSTTPPPQNKDEKILWIRNIAKEFIKTIDQETSEKIIFVKQGRSNDKDIPMAEVRFESKEIASKLRKMFVEKRKAGQDFGRVYMANSVTLATRVRVDIMKAIAKEFGGKDDLEMYVSAYTSRPVLRINNTRTQKSGVLTFTDSIGRFGRKLNLDCLNDAYRRAGRAFAGQMEQNFVVLTDNRKAPAPTPTQTAQSGPSGSGNAKKRPLEDQQTMFNESKGARVERGGRGGRGMRGERGRGTFAFRARGMASGSDISTPRT